MDWMVEMKMMMFWSPSDCTSVVPCGSRLSKISW